MSSSTYLAWNDHESDRPAQSAQDHPGSRSPCGIQPDLADVYHFHDLRHLPLGIPLTVLPGMGTLPARRDMQ